MHGMLFAAESASSRLAAAKKLLEENLAVPIQILSKIGIKVIAYFSLEVSFWKVFILKSVADSRDR